VSIKAPGSASAVFTVCRLAANWCRASICVSASAARSAGGRVADRDVVVSVQFARGRPECGARRQGDPVHRWLREKLRAVAAAVSGQAG
jgi:hypothetical protein